VPTGIGFELVLVVALLALVVAAFVVGRRLRAAPVPTPKRAGLRDRVSRLVGKERPTDEDWRWLEEGLVRADAGRKASAEVVTRVRQRHEPGQDSERLLIDEIAGVFDGDPGFALPSEELGVVVVVGVNGTGKTTTIGKLAHRLKAEGRSVAVANSDTFRAAAGEQVEEWARRAGAEVVAAQARGADPGAVAFDAVEAARARGRDVVIVDTAGRLHVDEEMMREARRVKDAIKPHHVLMACDAMTGQDAVVQARAFMRDVDTTGFVLTKLDGDARGGAALSITAVTGRPVFFAGTGERAADLEPFHPDRMASRIMGMGDVLSLIDKAQDNLDAERAAEAAKKMADASFTLEDFLEQMEQVRKLGPLQDLLAMLPGVPGGKNALKDLQVDDGQMARAEAIIRSMTREERRDPAMIGGSRRLRIARGSGTTTAEVNALLKEFEQARKMMKSMLGGKRMPRIPGMPNLPGLG
jgi:signal recognition particle subunit SRP54